MATTSFEHFAAIKADILSSVNAGFDGIKNQMQGMIDALKDSTAQNRVRFDDLYNQDKNRREEIAKLALQIEQAKSYCFELVTKTKADTLAALDGAIASVRSDNAAQQTDIDSLKTTAQVVEKLQANTWMKWGLVLTSLIGVAGLLIGIL